MDSATDSCKLQGTEKVIPIEHMDWRPWLDFKLGTALVDDGQELSQRH